MQIKLGDAGLLILEIPDLQTVDLAIERLQVQSN